jgi:hypothetical protein
MVRRTTTIPDRLRRRLTQAELDAFLDKAADGGGHLRQGFHPGSPPRIASTSRDANGDRRGRAVWRAND